MLKTKILLLLFFYFQLTFAQSPLVLEGKVTFVTQGNVYVKFANTSLIKTGDTLFTKKNGTEEYVPMLIVNATSSSTCVASYLSNNIFVVGQVIYSFQIPKIINKEPVKKLELFTKKASPKDTSIKKEIPKIKFPKIHGRISLSNSNNFSTTANIGSSRQLASLTLQATNLGNERISAETNMGYSLVQPAAPSDYTSNQPLFRIYGLSVKYNFKNGGQAVLGRSYNYNLSSIGAIDGIQVDRKYKKFIAGIIIGYRPDMYDLSFNSKLFQIGAYVGHNFNKGNFSSNTSLGYIEQRNDFKIDRKYVAFQHSSYYKKIRIFGSSEMELYNPGSNNLRITSVYASANFNLTKKAAFMLSYDTRKTIIFYETYKSFFLQYLLNDYALNGIRLSWNMQWGKGIYSSLSTGLRYQSNDDNKSNNYNASLSWNDIPKIKSNITLSANSNTSNSLQTQSYSATISKYIIANKFQISVHVNHQEYQYLKWLETHIENEYYGGSLSYNFPHQFALYGYYEFSIIDSQKYQNINLNLTKRF